LALVALFVGCVPVLGWLCWFLGLVLSIAGISKEPKGLATAGLIISLIGLLILLFFVGSIASILSEFGF